MSAQLIPVPQRSKIGTFNCSTQTEHEPEARYMVQLLMCCWNMISEGLLSPDRLLVSYNTLKHFS
jgi:hypothetical protein